jgi:hypothetical protein
MVCLRTLVDLVVTGYVERVSRYAGMLISANTETEK